MTPEEEARRAFIRNHAAIDTAPLVPELRLWLATEITPLWLASEAFLNEAGVAPPFWAFAWPGGQALARHVLDHPATVRGRRVLDFAAGCGLAGLAAVRAGARAVTCADIDPLAGSAVALNAALNGLTETVSPLCADVTAAPEAQAEQQRWDVILAGDVCYEQPMADRVLAFLHRAAWSGALVLLADPGRAYMPADGLEPVARFAVPTTLELEDRQSRDTAIVRVSPRPLAPNVAPAVRRGPRGGG